MGERSKVYMTDLRCRPGVSLLNKLEKLMRTAGIGEILSLIHISEPTRP